MKSLIAAVCLVCLSASWIFAKEIVIATAEEIEGTDIQQIEWGKRGPPPAGGIPHTL